MFSSSVEELSTDVFASPWKTSGENPNVIPAGDHNVYTTISPKYEIMSTIPEECSPIFSISVDSFDKKLSIDLEKSEEMIGSIFDYIGTEDDNGNARTSIKDNLKPDCNQNDITKSEEKTNVEINNSIQRPPTLTPSNSLNFSKPGINSEKRMVVCGNNKVIVQYRKKWTSFTV